MKNSSDLTPRNIFCCLDRRHRSRLPRLCHWRFLRPEELRGVIPLLTLLEPGAWSRYLLTCPGAGVVLRQTKPTNSCVATSLVSWGCHCCPVQKTQLLSYVGCCSAAVLVRPRSISAMLIVPSALLAAYGKHWVLQKWPA